MAGAGEGCQAMWFLSSEAGVPAGCVLTSSPDPGPSRACPLLKPFPCRLHLILRGGVWASRDGCPALSPQYPDTWRVSELLR